MESNNMIARKRVLVWAGRRLHLTTALLIIVVIGLLLAVARTECRQFPPLEASTRRATNQAEDKSDTPAAAAAAGRRREDQENIHQGQSILETWANKHDDDAGNKAQGDSGARARRSPTEDLGAGNVLAKKRYGIGGNKAPRLGSEQSGNGFTSSAELTSQQLQQQQSMGATSRTAGSSIKNVTAQNGQSVLLHCIVEPSGDLAVSWFRGSGEPQLLTYEANTVIDDERFVVHHGLLKENDWALQIKSLDKSTDSGLYQCQTNSEPPESQFYQLNIIEPQVHILGAPDLAVKLGAQINLTCVISQSPDQLPFIFWYRNERMINYDLNERGRIVNSKWPHKQDTIVSNLQIHHSRLSDSANYTCAPSGARPMTITVHVLEGFDKRLIMFQNDNSLSGNYVAEAASSMQQQHQQQQQHNQQQYTSNSALSVHVVRLSRGRVYALFWAFIIFSTWFQLVAQVQTAISLFLLAIIGFFLGQATNGQRQEPHAARYDDAGGDGDAERKKQLLSAHSKTKKSKRTNNDSKKSRSPTDESDTSKSSDEQHIHTETMMMDPLIKQAHSALNLLKNFSDDGSLESVNEDSSAGVGRKKAALKSNQCNNQKQHQRSPTSPSSSTNSSSVSTGYNSDTRSTNLVVSRATTNDTSMGVEGNYDLDTELTSLDTLRVVRLRRRLSSTDESGNKQANEGQEIELVSEPTAMRLIMDELTGWKQPRPTNEQTTAINAMSSLSVQTTSANIKAPLKPPRHQFYSTGNGMDDDQDEPHYSSPTFIAAHHRRRFTAAASDCGGSPSPSNTCRSVN